MADKNGQRVDGNRTSTPGAMRDQNIPTISKRPECDRRSQRHLRERTAKTGHDERSPPNQYERANRAKPGHAGITQSPNAPRRMATVRMTAAGDANAGTAPRKPKPDPARLTPPTLRT